MTRTFRINFEWPDGTPDSIVLSGEDVPSIRAEADQQMASRGVGIETCWSEEIGA